MKIGATPKCVKDCMIMEKQTLKFKRETSANYLKQNCTLRYIFACTGERLEFNCTTEHTKHKIDERKILIY